MRFKVLWLPKERGAARGGEFAHDCADLRAYPAALRVSAKEGRRLRRDRDCGAAAGAAAGTGAAGRKAAG